MEGVVPCVQVDIQFKTFTLSMQSATSQQGWSWNMLMYCRWSLLGNIGWPCDFPGEMHWGGVSS